MFKKLVLVFSLLLSLAPFAYGNQPGSCTPFGYGGFGPPSPWDWIANGIPSSDTCWSKSGVTYWDASSTGLLPWCGSVYNRYYQFSFGGTPALTQEIPITHATVSTMTLYYHLEFDDSYNDSNDVLYVSLLDETTSTYLTNFIAWSGASGNPCGTNGGQQKVTIYNTSGLNGHTLLLRFATHFVNRDVGARINGVSLYDGNV